MKPRDAEHAQDWLYERAEEAAAVGLPLDQALQAVRDGYSSIEADRQIREDLELEGPGDTVRITREALANLEAQSERLRYVVDERDRLRKRAAELEAGRS